MKIQQTNHLLLRKNPVFPHGNILYSQAERAACSKLFMTNMSLNKMWPIRRLKVPLKTSVSSHFFSLKRLTSAFDKISLNHFWVCGEAAEFRNSLSGQCTRVRAIVHIAYLYRYPYLHLNSTDTNQTPTSNRIINLLKCVSRVVVYGNFIYDRQPF